MKAAVIGVGRMGRRHLQVLQSLGIPIAGVVDRDALALEAARDEFGLAAAQTSTDATALLAATQPECVVVATTAPSHAELTCLAATMGAHYILCEKPMAVSIAECDRMIETCVQAGARLAINHQMRFMEQYVRPKQLLDSAALGGLSSITVVAGNFGLAMNGTHYFEMFRFLTDEEPCLVAASFSAEPVRNPRGPEFEDQAGCIRLVTPRGRRFYMDASADHGHGLFAVYAGPLGRIEVDELAGRMRTVVRAPEHRNLPTTRYAMPSAGTDESIAPADAIGPTRAVLEAVLAERNYPDGACGRLAVKTLVAAYVSNEQGAPTLMSDELPRDRVFRWA